jgi:NADH-quinone oxidoreductase subunit L
VTADLASLLVIALPGLPLAAFAVNALFGRRWLGHWTGWIASGALGLAALDAVAIFVLLASPGAEGGAQPRIVEAYRWIAIGGLDVRVAFQIDQLSTLMALVVTSVSFVIHVYSIGYMHGDRGFWRFFTWLPLFVFFMLTLVLADNYLLMFVGWEGVGLCSYLLIGYWFERSAPAAAATKAFLMNRIGDWGFTVGMILIFLSYQSLNFVEVFERAHTKHADILPIICLLLFLGATGKSAQIPLYTWLPDAMEGPTPVSALIHAATMVTAGVYMVARSMPLFEAAPAALTVIAVVGTLTALVAATIALVQTDIKRVMAYSTVSQLGYMFLALGAGAPVAAMFHLATHAFFKALLFLGSGSVIHALGGEQDMRRMGGLRAKLPLTYWTMVIGGAALAALPPLAGFWSKDEILSSAFVRGDGYRLLWGVGLLTGALTAFYTTRAIWLTFHGPPQDRHLYEHAHESPRVMVVPLVVLAVGAAVAGLALGYPPDAGPIHAYLEPVFAREAAHVELATLLLLALVSTIGGLIGVGASLLLYGWRRLSPAAVARASGPLYPVLSNRYFLDELYDRRFVDAFKVGAGASWAFDLHIIDGLVNKLGLGFEYAGRGLRRLQTGVVGNYALTIVVGLLFVGATFAYLAFRQ